MDVTEDPRAVAARMRMVDRLTEEATRPPAVVAALRTVPRHRFVDPFWAAGPDVTHARQHDLRPWRTTGDDVDDYALDLAYAPHQAIAIVPPDGDAWPTSTASAPNLMADMIELLELQPGMRVLEIGVGSGYNAALLAAVLGDASAVTSIDIDGRVVQRARSALHDTGYGPVNVVEADGFDGWHDGSPFDRIIATVGCTDISPHWLEQLGPDGFLLVPLEHGGLHPVLRAHPEGAHAVGRMVARSGFVRVQGQLAGEGPWPFGRTPIVGETTWARLPTAVIDGLAARSGTGEWDLAYFVGLEDRRAGHLVALVDGHGSAVRISGRRGEVGWTGPSGEDLRDQLLTHAAHWTSLGAPASGDYHSRFVPLSEPAPAPALAERTWVVDRVRFRQIVTL